MFAWLRRFERMPRKRDQMANFCHDFDGTNNDLMGLRILEHEQPRTRRSWAGKGAGRR
jgi:hypothetical protein